MNPNEQELRRDRVEYHFPDQEGDVAIVHESTFHAEFGFVAVAFESQDSDHDFGMNFSPETAIEFAEAIKAQAQRVLEVRKEQGR